MHSWRGSSLAQTRSHVSSGVVVVVDDDPAGRQVMVKIGARTLADLIRMSDLLRDLRP
jgi:hypothetical protein